MSNQTVDSTLLPPIVDFLARERRRQPLTTVALLPRESGALREFVEKRDRGLPFPRR